MKLFSRCFFIVQTHKLLHINTIFIFIIYDSQIELENYKLKRLTKNQLILIIFLNHNYQKNIIKNKNFHTDIFF